MLVWVVHTYSPNTLKTDAEESQFQTSLGYTTRPCFQNKERGRNLAKQFLEEKEEEEEEREGEGARREGKKKKEKEKQ